MLAAGSASLDGHDMRRIASLLALATPLTPALATPPELAPPPQVLLAQAEEADPDDPNEESLTVMDGGIIDERSWSMTAAIGLSLVPGGGFGLFYVEKPGAGWATIALSAIGYGVGAAYMLGVFDEQPETRCRFKDEVAEPEECESALDRTGPLRDEKNPRTGNFYSFEVEDFSRVTTGEDYDGTTTGLAIASTATATPTNRHSPTCRSKS
jgi:hypothetical protein